MVLTAEAHMLAPRFKVQISGLDFFGQSTKPALLPNPSNAASSTSMTNDCSLMGCKCRHPQSVCSAACAL